MPSIRERKRRDGSTAYLVIVNEDGRQKARTFQTREEAEHAAANPDMILAPDYTGHMPTVNEWAEHHITHLTGVERSTLDSYYGYLHNDIAPTMGSLKLSAVTPATVSRWITTIAATPSSRTGRPPSTKTLANKHGFLSGLFGSAVTAGLIPTNPAAGHRLPRNAGGRSRDMRMLSRDEFKALLSHTPEHSKLLLIFLVTSGCRWGEASALKPEDINLSAGTVHIRRAWKYSSNGYQIGPPKTRRSDRIINIPTDICQQALDNACNEWIFHTDERPIRYHAFKRQVWDKAVTKSGLNPRPTPHDLRHTCASWLLGSGIPITTVSRHLGHESIKVTVDIYGDVDRSSFEAASATMRQFLLDI